MNETIIKEIMDQIKVPCYGEYVYDITRSADDIISNLLLMI